MSSPPIHISYAAGLDYLLHDLAVNRMLALLPNPSHQLRSCGTIA